MALIAQASFQGPDVGWFALSPLIVLVGAALALLIVGALTPTWPRGLYAWVTVAAAVAAGGLAMMNWDDITDRGTKTLVDGALAFDTFAMFVTIAICAAGCRPRPDHRRSSPPRRSRRPRASTRCS